ncbi:MULTISPECIES: O-methyltransferase [unclassified Bacillus (in: firmicutes)]|uniref:O-methyltransferase n=1 Tax=unclassified Bacillus (in: firmicutes) TaxID=185979 RepID=UPI0008F21DFE|nr:MULTISPECIES: O-methyltransferase [unclassified Bacillus (in: firmicutes)]SFA94976.1 Predicted O-methyltransferase YrrM [Bacillus sp. UNCCL13]SFQ78806.1 Predicted O-methyltransferase YrrM [Bacillus sp. cl95]
MINEKLQAYLENLVPERNSLLLEMEEYAQQHAVPIMERTGIEILLQLLRIQDAKNILEVGTAIGYSALRMATALQEAKIVSIERDDERFQLAEAFIARSEIGNRIKLIHADALEAEAEISTTAPYDVIFIDAAKGQYKKFFELYSKYLNEDGVIITDNVLFKGLVCEEEIESKRIRSLVRKIDAYNQWLSTHPEYDTVILPVGDGVAITRKKHMQEEVTDNE